MIRSSEVADLFADAGVRGWMHAVRLDAPGTEYELGPDTPVVMASVYKLPVLVTFCRLVDSGELDPRQPVELDPATRTIGPTGISQFLDPVRVSLRDLVRSMMTVSDNAAADEVLQRIGVERVNTTLEELGTRSTRIVGGTAEVLRTLVADTGASSSAEAIARIGDNNRIIAPTGYDPVLSSSTTPRDMTRLLSAVWSGDAVSPEQTGFIRSVMSSQVFTARLRSGFPYGDVNVAGKTGTLGAIRNEAGVIEFPGGDAFAVAVFTKAARADALLPKADAAIGLAARAAIAELRRRG